MADSPNIIEKNYDKYIFKHVCIQSCGKVRQVQLGEKYETRMRGKLLDLQNFCKQNSECI